MNRAIRVQLIYCIAFHRQWLIAGKQVKCIIKIAAAIQFCVNLHADLTA
jgi:hypothetical protein